MTFTPPPCKDCTGRSVGCHSGCPAWKDWKAQEDQKHAQMDDYLREEKVFQAIHAERDKKITRRLMRRC